MFKFANKFHLGLVQIKNYNRPYIIAEVGSNFDQNLNLAFKYIDLCKKIGVDCVKFQLFKASDLLSSDHKSYNLFLKNELPIKWLRSISNFAKKKKIDFMCSPFSVTAVKELEKINISCYKVASSELLNFNLLNALAKTKKPLILSTGLASIDEVKLSLSFLKIKKVKKIALLQCTSNYPTENKDLNLNVIDTYRNIFKNIPVGLSDHSRSFMSPALAVSKGACIIEKHITLNNNNEGPDHFYALNPINFKLMVNAVNNSHISNGNHEKKIHFLEKKYGRKKSLYYCKTLKKGQKISFDLILVKNSEKGINPKNIKKILNKRLKKNVSKNQIIRVGDF